MKLPSSPVIVYLIVYSFSFIVSIILHFLLFSYISSPLYRVYFIDFCVTCILYLIGNYIYSSNNIYDLHWPLLPLICLIYFHFTTELPTSFPWKSLPLLIAVPMWSLHLIIQSVSSLNSIKDEDWRYKLMRTQYGDKFLRFAFFALHLFPMVEVLLGSSSIYYIYSNINVQNNFSITDYLSVIMILGAILEYAADNELSIFRLQKQKSKEHRFSVLSSGLWKYSRHPNYLGEIIFWWGLFIFGYFNNAPLWCILSPLLVTLMMVLGSIPMSEERLYRKYPEYKFLQRRIPILVPTFRN